MSVEIVVGRRPSAQHCSATVQLNEPAPWPMSMMTPRLWASCTALFTLRASLSMIVVSKPWKQCVSVGSGS